MRTAKKQGKPINAISAIFVSILKNTEEARNDLRLFFFALMMVYS